MHTVTFFDSSMMIGDDKNHWSFGSSLHFLFARVNGDAQYQDNVFMCLSVLTRPYASINGWAPAADGEKFLKGQYLRLLVKHVGELAEWNPHLISPLLLDIENLR